MAKEQDQQYATILKTYISNKDEASTLIKSLSTSPSFQEYLNFTASVSMGNNQTLSANVINAVCIQKDFAILELLVKNGADINKEVCGRTPLACILKYNSKNHEDKIKCLNLLLDQDKIDLDTSVQKTAHDTYQTVVPDDFEGAERVVKYIQYNALTWCIVNFKENQEVFEILIDAYDEKGKLKDIIILPYMVKYSYVLQQLIVPIYNFTNGTYLDCAVYQNQLPVVTKLLELGCNPNDLNPSSGVSYCALQWAIDPYVTLNPQIIDTLLKNGAEIFIQNDEDKNYISIGLPDLIQIIHKNAKNIKESKQENPYLESIKLLQTALIEQGKQKNIDVSQLNSHCESVIKLLGDDYNEMPLVDDAA